MKRHADVRGVELAVLSGNGCAKPQPGQERAAVVARAKGLLRELEAQIASREKLYERA